MKPYRSWRRRAAVALPLALALGLSACSSSDSGAAGSTDSAERVSIAMLQPPRSGLSPLSDDAFKLSRWATAETLIVLDADSNALPSLATEWERVDDTT